MNVLVFARAPELGAVKTRLEPALGRERTLALYRAFLADTLASARQAGARVVLAHTQGAPEERAFADDAFAQQGASFGARFDHALAHARARTRGPLVLVGADTPHLGPDALRAALATLRGRDAILGPSTEGGFYLLGFRGDPVPVAACFDAPNEAAAVTRTTGAALIQASYDIDVPEDLVNLVLDCETREASGAWVPAHTMAALSTLGIRVDATAESGARRRRLVVDA